MRCGTNYFWFTFSTWSIFEVHKVIYIYLRIRQLKCCLLTISTCNFRKKISYLFSTLFHKFEPMGVKCFFKVVIVYLYLGADMRHVSCYSSQSIKCSLYFVPDFHFNVSIFYYFTFLIHFSTSRKVGMLLYQYLLVQFDMGIHEYFEKHP